MYVLLLLYYCWGLSCKWHETLNVQNTEANVTWVDSYSYILSYLYWNIRTRPIFLTNIDFMSIFKLQNHFLTLIWKNVNPECTTYIIAIDQILWLHLFYQDRELIWNSQDLQYFRKWKFEFCLMVNVRNLRLALGWKFRHRIFVSLGRPEQKPVMVILVDP